MTDVVNRVIVEHITDTSRAVRETQKLADAQVKGAQVGTKAVETYADKASAALGKVDKSWEKVQKSAEAGSGAFAKALDSAKGYAEKFNRAVGLVNSTMGNVKTAIELGTTAVHLLGKAWEGVASVINGKPELRMLWEESPHKRWIEMMKEKEAATKAWADSLRATYFGADVDSDKNMARRLEYRRQLQQRKDNADFLSQAKLEEQNAAVQKQYADSAARAAANREKEREAAAARRASGGRELPDFSTGWGATLGRARDWVGTGLADQAEIDRLKALAVDVLGTLREGAGVVGDVAGPRYEAEGTEIGRRTGGQGFNRLDESKGPGLLERVFGPKKDFDFYADALGTLRDATAEVYTALVTGSESAGAALKRVVGTAIMASGKEMAIEALKEGAWAIKELAKGNLPAAAMHGKSALMFGAGAVAAGIAASQLGAGGGGASPAPAAPTPGGYAGVNVAGGGGPVSQTFIFGDSFGYSTPRTQAAFFRQAQNRAARYSRPAEGVE